MERDCYSPLKIFHHRDRIDALREGGRLGLLHAQLILTNRCNQRCHWCAYRLEGYASNEKFRVQDQISQVKLAEIVESCKLLGVKAVEITGGGEPTLHPGFARVCRWLTSVDIEYGVVTNGYDLDDEIFEALLGASWIRISIDAGSSETYAAQRHAPGEAFDRVRGNLRHLVNQRAILNRDGPVIGVGFVVTQENYDEIFKAVHNAQQDRADNIRISAVFQNEGAGYFEGFYQKTKLLCGAAKQLQDDKFQVFNLFGDRLEDLQQQSPSHPFCPLQQLCTYIGADLNVYRCCMLAYNHLGLLGNIEGQSLHEMWRSEETSRRFQDFDATKCPRCMFNKKNETIRYACSKHPSHVNFL